MKRMISRNFDSGVIFVLVLCLFVSYPLQALDIETRENFDSSVDIIENFERIYSLKEDGEMPLLKSLLLFTMDPMTFGRMYCIAKHSYLIVNFELAASYCIRGVIHAVRILFPRTTFNLNPGGCDIDEWDLPLVIVALAAPRNSCYLGVRFVEKINNILPLLLEIVEVPKSIQLHLMTESLAPPDKILENVVGEMKKWVERILLEARTDFESSIDKEQTSLTSAIKKIKTAKELIYLAGAMISRIVYINGLHERIPGLTLTYYSSSWPDPFLRQLNRYIDQLENKLSEMTSTKKIVGQDNGTDISQKYLRLPAPSIDDVAQIFNYEGTELSIDKFQPIDKEIVYDYYKAGSLISECTIALTDIADNFISNCKIDPQNIFSWDNLSGTIGGKHYRAGKIIVSMVEDSNSVKAISVNENPKGIDKIIYFSIPVIPIDAKKNDDPVPSLMTAGLPQAQSRLLYEALSRWMEVNSAKRKK